MLKMKKTRLLLSSTLISISVLAFAAIVYVAHIGNITKKDEIKENAINTTTVQDFSTRAASIKVAAGYDSYAAIINGRLYTWGNNGYGQLGHGHTSSISRPTWVSSLGSGVTDISFGHDYAGAINHSGLHMWGQNTYGQLGTGDKSPRYSPTEIIYSNGLSSISCSTAIDRTADGHHTAVIWGNDIYTWGSGSNSRLGHHNDDGDRSSPGRTEYIRQENWGEENKGYKPLTVRVGAKHTLGVVRLPNGYQGVFSFGDSNRNSQIAFTVTPWLSRDFPTTWDNQVVRDEKFYGGTVKVDTYNDHNIATINGTMWTWGDNATGQHGMGIAGFYSYATPRYTITNLTNVFSGRMGHMAITSGGVLHTWGSDKVAYPAYHSSGGWTQVAATMATTSGTNIGVRYDQVWTWTRNGTPYIYNINDYVTIDLNATNDPEGYRNSVVYNLDAAELRKLINSSSSRMSLPSPYETYDRSNLGATPIGANMQGTTNTRVAFTSNYWFFTTYLTLRGFLPVQNTVYADTGNMVLNANDKDPAFANIGINQFVEEANKNDEKSKLADWIYNKSSYTNVINPSNLYTVYFPRNTRITGVRDFEYVRNPIDPNKWDIHFKITVDKYYKTSGTNLIEWTSGPDLALDKYITITNLPQVIFEEDCVDENKNLIILNTRINDDTIDITNSDQFFTSLTGNTVGGIVTDISLDKSLLRKYIDIRFIPDWYYDVDLKIQVKNVITLTSNSTWALDSSTNKLIDFTITANKFYTNHGELKSDYTKAAQFSIERNTSAIEQIMNTQELTKQYTTGDFIDLIAPYNASTESTTPNNNIDTKIARNYLKFINFPGDTIYDLITTNEQNENEQGKLAFKVSANQYYTADWFELQKVSKTFETLFTLDSFIPAYDITTHPVELQQDKITQIQSSANFYDEITSGTSGKINMENISEYLNVLAIPKSADVSLVRLDNNTNSAIKFQIVSDRYTDNGGRTIKQMKKWEFEIKVANVDTALIIILVTASIFLVFIIWALIVTIKNKRSVEIQHGNEII